MDLWELKEIGVNGLCWFWNDMYGLINIQVDLYSIRDNAIIVDRYDNWGGYK